MKCRPPLVGERATVRPARRGHRRSRRRSLAIGARRGSGGTFAPAARTVRAGEAAGTALLAAPRRPHPTAPDAGHGGEARRSRAPNSEEDASLSSGESPAPAGEVEQWQVRPARAPTHESLVEDAARPTSSE